LTKATGNGRKVLGGHSAVEGREGGNRPVGRDSAGIALTPETDNPLRDAVRTVRKMRTQRNIARRAGLRAETLNRFLNGKQNMSPKAMAAVRRELDAIDNETADTFSTLLGSLDLSEQEIHHRLAIIERVNIRLQKETEGLRRRPRD
jgi:transcriptional regulator with XRE-family HTH domain